MILKVVTLKVAFIIPCAIRSQTAFQSLYFINNILEISFSCAFFCLSSFMYS